jgi:hypothetical protein
MAYIITNLTTRSLRIALTALMFALLVAVVFMAVSTSTTLAAQNNNIATSPSAAQAPRWNAVGFTLSSIPGTWKRDPGPPTVRTKTSYGSIVLDLNDNVDYGICVRLLAARNGSVLGYTRCWPAGSYGPQTMATHVLAKTRFTVWATKMHSSQTNNNAWGGRIYY